MSIFHHQLTSKPATDSGKNEYKHSALYLVRQTLYNCLLIFSHVPNTVLKSPPPWTLTGSGIILVAHFPEAFVQSQGFLEPYQQRSYRGWVGTVMIVNYTASPVGPYQELLFIPGLFQFGSKTSFSISKIYVSTPESVWNGRYNWGIPKELANFLFDKNSDGSQSIRVSYEGNLFLSLRAKPWSFRFPITTAVLPGFQVVQHPLTTPATANQASAKLLLTRPSARGSARLATLSDVQVDPLRFPDIDRVKPLAVLAVENFQMTFPSPEAY